MSLRIVMACAVFLMMLSIVTAAHADPNMTAVLVLKKGSEISAKDFDGVLRTDAVVKVKNLSAPADLKKAKLIAATEVAKSWLLELRDDRAFDQVERRIRRAGLPLQLEWNDFKANPQSLSQASR